jgi:mono/diheme cytochrome c family protein
VTEIPEHLLERSRARRAALGLGGGDAAAAAPAQAADGGSAPASAAPAKAAAAAPVAASKKPEVVQSPEVRAANGRKKIPWWAAPVLLFLPLWSFLYVQTLDEPKAAAEGVLAEGEAVYAKCAGCHGATGGGAGAIPGFTNGELLAVFPDAAGQVEWVIKGSDGFKAVGTYGATNRPVAGGMPGWASSLTAKELLAVIYYERVQFGGETEEAAAQLKAVAESTKLPAKFDAAISLEDIQKLMDEISPPTAG